MFAKAVSLLKSTAFRKGVTGTSSRWLAVWVGVALTQQARKRLGKPDVVVERIVLKPGQEVRIRDTGVSWEDAGA